MGSNVTEPNQEGLGRSLKSRHVSMIAIGGIIGAGLFVGSSTAIVTVGPAVTVSYALAGLLVLLVMRILTEMAMANPGAGSFTEFVRRGLGDWGGFVSGWLYWYFWVVVVAIEAIAGAKILELWFPAFAEWQIAVVLLLLMMGVNLTSTRSYGEFEFWLSLMKVVGIVGFILIAAIFAFGITAPGGPTFGNLTAHDGFAPFGPLAILAGITSVIFALTGAEIATIAAAEADEPEKTIAKITSSVAVRILLFYVVSIFLIVSVVPWTTIEAGISPFATALEGMNIPYADTVMNFIVLVAVLSCLNSGLYVTSRVLFVLAACGDAPKALAAVNKKRVPIRATLLASGVAGIALAASYISGDLFSFLVNASGAIMLFIYLLLCVSQIMNRRDQARQGIAPPSVRMWFYPWSTYAVILGILGVLVAMVATPALASQFYLSLLVAVGVGACYPLVRRRKLQAAAAE
ncbi:amino acid permease [Phenylobacterium sp.]|uniref:amino acid permease n=1 Tax=Phenylobacterium sp. TaxID=1871053 RepID=UPI0037846906